ncbi:6-hydroxymethylpterin diphosphokinase MptE-like protein [Oleisolibacter albus]|uniref:motility associated factor glycosyltransferase family protein n=1 Tax=Oleisolibacter albus TaxID=2171757 RepID=UPI000DF49152|nr:6-hydroxymethylpterin diphosphokinase MptE-like protein [Oleisolibacter albus]
MTEQTPPAAPAPSAADPSQVPPLEAIDLFERNMRFFARALPSLYQGFLTYKPTKQLLWYPDGEVNVRGPNGLMYPTGGRAENEAQAKKAMLSPQQIVIGGASTIPEAPRLFSKKRRAALPTFDWPTQYYDDRDQDAHSDDFLVDVFDYLESNGIKLSTLPKVQNPYFVVLYGMGLGTDLLQILEYHRPRVLLLCEIDIDLVYFSCFLMDWEKLYRTAESWGGKVLLNMALSAVEIYRTVAGTVAAECNLAIDGMISYVHTPCEAPLRIAAAEFHTQRTAQFASFFGFIVDEINMMKNTFRNLQSGTRRVLGHVSESCKLPVIVVASGPSVTASLDFIRENKDRAIIISCGSALRILTRAGIKPDFHCNLERAKEVYDMHVELQKETDLSDIYAVMTTTVWPGIDSFFKDTIYFFRAPLSPVGVFVDRDDEILNHEGPTVTNTAFSLAMRLQAPEVYLCGVDLGSADPKRTTRNPDAWGVTPRELTIPVRGNYGTTVFTDQTLVRQRLNLEEQIRLATGQASQTKVYNLSNGVRIDGAMPARPGYVRMAQPVVEKAEHLTALVQQFPVYTRERFETAWLSSEVRDGVQELIKFLTESLVKADDWDHTLMHALDQVNQYSHLSFRRQYARRLLRGSLTTMSQTFQSVLNRLEDQSRRKEVFNTLRNLYLDMLERAEREAYGLADELEAEDGAFGVMI